MSRLLLLSYGFPPAPMGYAQRVAKLCKYLPSETRWLPSVICGHFPKDFLPGEDEPLLEEIPDCVSVTPVPSFLSSNVAQWLRRCHLYKPVAAWRKFTVFPDAYGDWIGKAVKAAERQYPSGKGISCILTSGPPNSVYIAGLHLSQRWRIPFVVDMRDSWVHTLRPQPTFWHLRRIASIERTVYEYASIIVANTQSNACDLKIQYPLCSQKIVVIPNGFDPDDLDATRGSRLRVADEPANTIHLLYLGGIRGSIMGNIFERDFLQAIADFRTRPSASRYNIRVDFVGATSSEIAPLARAFRLTDICQAYGVVSSNAVGRPLNDADIYVLILPKEWKHGCIPSKLYYYLAGARQIYALVPDGSARELINSLGVPTEFAFPGRRTEAVEALERAVQCAYESRSSDGPWRIPPYALPFDRRKIAQQMGAVLDRACKGA